MPPFSFILIRAPARKPEPKKMLTLSQKLTRAYLDLHQSDAQELVTAAKTILSDFLSEEDKENQTIADARDSAMSVIQEEAEARIWLGDDDPFFCAQNFDTSKQLAVRLTCCVIPRLAVVC